jgi:hippurate hydrolase
MNPLLNPAYSLDDEIISILPEVVDLYKDLHANPELSLQEYKTAARMASFLETYGFEVTTAVGQTGVVGILRNGNGPVVMLRADMDALPVKEESGLPYASQVISTDRQGKQVPVMHACGHDIHMTCVAGAAKLLSKNRSAWQGTLMIVFQPAEETSEGAIGMVRDGLYERFPLPDVILGQHVINTPVGTVTWSKGAATSTGDSLRIRLIGRGSHGAMPENSIDPVVMAAAVVLRLQTIVSRELPANEAAIVTIGSLQAGTMENIIPDEAIIKVNVRTYDEKIRQRVLCAIERIVQAEAMASGAETPPEITTINHFSLVANEVNATQRLVEALKSHFPVGSVQEAKPTKMSDDIGEFNLGSTIPSVYWFIGSTDPEVHAEYVAQNRLADLPTNHNPKFTPLPDPTIANGIKAMAVGALEWLEKSK